MQSKCLNPTLIVVGVATGNGIICEWVRFSFEWAGGMFRMNVEMFT